MTRPSPTQSPWPQEPCAPRWWLGLTGVAVALLGLFLPFSSAGVSLSLAALVLLALLRPAALWRAAPWAHPVMAVGLLLMVYIALHTLWVTGPNRTALGAINHYHELLLAPLLMMLFARQRERDLFFRALVVGCVLLACAYWAGLFFPGIAVALLTRRISAGFILAVCAFLVLMRARAIPTPWPARALAAFLALTVLFAISGRTGHVVLLVLVAVAAWMHSPRRWRWLAALACPLLVLALASSSGLVSGRIQETLAGAQSGSAPGTSLDQMTSTGIRIELMRTALDLARRHGLSGAGFANYASVHEQAARARYQADPQGQRYLSASWINNGNPHNEYLMQLICGGIVAAALFMAWLALSLRAAAQAAPPLAGQLMGVTLAFAVGCVFNSLLLDFTEGHFHMALLAWLLAAQRNDLAGAAAHPIERVLVVATRQIGDVLLTSPLIRAARQRWPQARIDVLGLPGTLGMLRGNPDVNALIEAPARGQGAYTPLGAPLRQLWRRYDLALITDPGDRAHLLGWVAAPLRSGIIAQRHASNWWKRLMLHHTVVAAGDLGAVHVTTEKLALLEPWRAGPGEPAMPATPAASTMPAAAAQVVAPAASDLPASVQTRLRAGFVVVHAPSMWPYKQWPLQHFAELVRALLAQDRQVVLTGSASARDQECIAALRPLGTPVQVLDLSGQLDFNQLVTLLRQAALYIGPDTSVSHLAAATGVPVIAIFGPTNPMRWAPWPAQAGAQQLFQRSALVQHAGNVTLLQAALPCVPCGRAGCEDHRQSRSDCLVAITPQRVMAQVMHILRRMEVISCTENNGENASSSARASDRPTSR